MHGRVFGKFMRNLGEGIDVNHMPRHLRAIMPGPKQLAILSDLSSHPAPKVFDKPTSEGAESFDKKAAENKAHRGKSKLWVDSLPSARILAIALTATPMIKHQHALIKLSGYQSEFRRCHLEGSLLSRGR